MSTSALPPYTTSSPAFASSSSSPSQPQKNLFSRFRSSMASMSAAARQDHNALLREITVSNPLLKSKEATSLLDIPHVYRNSPSSSSSSVRNLPPPPYTEKAFLPPQETLEVILKLSVLQFEREQRLLESP
ncbi:hypothetical protein JCM8547_003123 [Rhodosporidiobolus lusitaniae]